MSKQSEAKASQGYTTALNNCGSCAHRTCDRTFPKWIQEYVDAGEQSWNDDKFKQDSNVRCGIGGFAVKHSAHCSMWLAKVAA